ncbi:MAG: HesA/MoeB/ThiF family protein [Spirochaetales bacterium]|nr:HesA/MoeB/ThiF family protein [Spirochaetales bacterium]
MTRWRLSPDERARYQRQIQIPGWGERAQRRLAAATVFIAGAGGLGSPVALYLAAAGVGTLRICDAGRVELSNLNRQILHGQEDIGRDKAASAADRLARLNPAVQVVALTDAITRERIRGLVGEASLMVDCLDNFDARFVINQFALESGIPFIHAGVQGLCGQIGFFQPPQTPCLACLVPEAQAAATLPILGAAAGFLGCLEALEALKYLTGTGELLRGRLLFCDGDSMEFHEVSLERDPRCRVCGSRS